MASNRPKDLLDKVHRLSDSYHQITSDISDQFENFEQQLNSLKGKVKIEVGDRDGTKISYQRLNNRRWGLFTFVDGDFIHLPRASVSLKLKAAPLIENLLEAMVNMQNQRLAEAKIAHEKITSVLSKFEEAISKEGK